MKEFTSEMKWVKVITVKVLRNLCLLCPSASKEWDLDLFSVIRLILHFSDLSQFNKNGTV